jgi:hypothetical protein
MSAIVRSSVSVKLFEIRNSSAGFRTGFWKVRLSVNGLCEFWGMLL